jgi:hypothetical protein
MWLSKQDAPAVMPWNVSKHLAGQHDQREHGVWAEGSEGGVGGVGVAVQEFDTGDVLEGTTAQSIYDRMLVDEGISLNFRGKGPDSGYMVARVGNEVKIPEAEFSPQSIADYLKATRDKFGPPDEDTQMGRIGRERTFFGGWLDDGNWYLDISDMVPTLGAAAWASERNNQLAIWDVEGKRSLSYKDPEYRRAMRDEMMRSERRQARDRGGALSVSEVSDRQARERAEEWDDAK